MNERIKELMKEANKDITLGKPFWPALEEFSEKFARLIIKECGTVAGRDWDTAETAIYKHFGIEE